MDESARETYLDLIYDCSDLNELESQEAYEQFICSYRDEFDIYIADIKELFQSLFLTHIERYENPSIDRLSSRLSPIVIVEDPKSGRAIIVDGNHLWNSFNESNQYVKVVIVQAPVPSSICTYKA